MIRFGYSGLPTDGDDAAFLDGLVAKGHRAFELAFVEELPWSERRCGRFGALAAERDIRLSIHAPYSAVLTIADGERAEQCLFTIEHTMRLAKAAGARIVCVHLGKRYGRDTETLMELVSERLERIAPKVSHLGVGLGLETAGRSSAFGTLDDIASLVSKFPFARPYVDWAHLHAIGRGALATKEAFQEVFGFLRKHFPGWMIDPLQCQFSETRFGDKGEVRHVRYGEGSLRITNLVEAAREADVGLVIISEAREPESTEAMAQELQQIMGRPEPSGDTRRLGSGSVEFPVPIHVTPAESGFAPAGLGHPLVLSNIDKPFFPDGFTKGDLIHYYASIALTLLPHLAERAIVMARYPDGSEGEGFYEKQAPEHRPGWLRLAPVYSKHRGETIEFVTAADRESLMWLASMGCIEIHPWLNRLSNEDRPDFAVFDLDPSEGATWAQVVTVAEQLKAMLDRLGLIGHPKTSGATGLHIYVPLDPVHDYRRVRTFVGTVGRLLLAANPDDITMEWHVAKRGARVFIDHNQNSPGKTIASVYSVRPRPGAPVSTPIFWEEVDHVQPGDFTISTIWDRLRRFGDLFSPVLAGGQTLDAAEEALGLE
ncbi:MAG: TIM barrel protein [Gammaproteobacteria bacterium]|nr:TIM barrel protein [Gammaproteobacteria bacterium]